MDGLPCSGKSSTAQFVHRQLRERGIPARCLLEGRAINAACLWKETDRRKAVEALLDQWRRFTAKAIRSRRVTVMEPSWFQVTACFLLLHDFPANEIADYAASVERAIRPLHPRLIYLRAATAGKALEKMRLYRPRGWFRQNDAFIAGLPFAKSRRLGKREGLARFVREAWRLGDVLFGKATLRKLRLDITTEDWAACYARIGSFLSLPIVADKRPSPAYLRKFTGSYDLEGRRAGMTIRLGADGTLVARFRNWLPRVRLLFRRRHFFDLAGVPCELRFHLDRRGDVRAATAHGPPDWGLSEKTLTRRRGQGRVRWEGK